MFKINNEENPKSIYRLWVVLLVEFIATFAMVFWIIAPSSFGWNNPTQTTELGALMYTIFFSTFIGQAFYVGTFILILIFSFRNISANLNPVVSLSEVAVGKLKWSKAIPMIIAQFFGAIVASVLAYELINIIGTEAAQQSLKDGTFTLNSLSPKLSLPKLIGVFNGVEGWDYNVIKPWSTAAPDSLEAWSLGFLTFTIEFIFTFSLILPIVYFKNIKHNARPFIIYAIALTIIAFGSMTGNIALNPARLLAPAIITHITGGGQTMQYQFIFLAGELAAVSLVFLIESHKKEKILADPKMHQVVISKYSLIQEDNEDSWNESPIIIKVKKQWLKNKNQDLSKLSRNELASIANELNITFGKKESRNNIEDNITAYLVFGIK